MSALSLIYSLRPAKSHLGLLPTCKTVHDWTLRRIYSVWAASSERERERERVFNPHAPSNHSLNEHELEKKRAYEQRVREVEYATFTSLVMAAVTVPVWPMKPTIFFKRLPSGPCHLLTSGTTHTAAPWGVYAAALRSPSYAPPSWLSEVPGLHVDTPSNPPPCHLRN